MKNIFKVLGIMSGTSLDGIDLAFCEFRQEKNKWTFKIVETSWIKYSRQWVEKLDGAFNMSAQDYVSLDFEYGRFLGQLCKDFIKERRIRPDFIASHGHTIFHQPQNGFTAQIGNGNGIHAITSLPTVYDFRSLDVQRGGQGAPLVPAGDKFLFSDYDICLNLGGIANLSSDFKGERKAYDICFCNMPLNYLMEKEGKKFDKGGVIASNGELNQKLLHVLSKKYLTIQKERPSIGKELFLKSFKAIFDDKKISTPDKLATSVESTAIEIAKAAKSTKGKSMLCTGGGAFNSFLVSRILHHCGDDISIIVPDDDVVKFKEAIVFGFLGALRVSNQINVLKSVTKASRDSSSGLMVGFHD